MGFIDALAWPIQLKPPKPLKPLTEKGAKDLLVDVRRKMPWITGVKSTLYYRLTDTTTQRELDRNLSNAIGIEVQTVVKQNANTVTAGMTPQQKREWHAAHRALALRQSNIPSNSAVASVAPNSTTTQQGGITAPENRTTLYLLIGAVILFVIMKKKK